MIAYICSIALQVSTQLTCPNMPLVRDDFHKINSLEDTEKFIKLYRSEFCDRYTIYIASAVMRQAEYVSWPFTKLKFFKEGKSELEDYIETHPDDVEARYARYMIQSHVPEILGYHKEMKTDKEFILKNLDKSDIPAAYQAFMKENILKINQKH
ncbi:hypothetical protein [Robertkochia solimangrovi]|uniref:hypothetical protein n=1 Tax=Robertkochia solimangrovi TaxID=2213046 RepID=UPI00118119BF|nr:hypothetical protein [Robertkochia solimangrovi]TRZ42266.1 hypothetical protein DMZ48_14655 [Robertkochia solimangrovi]